MILEKWSNFLNKYFDFDIKNKKQALYSLIGALLLGIVVVILWHFLLTQKTM